MTEDELLSVVKTEFSEAMGLPGGEISKERALAWDRYLRKPLGNEVEDESEVVTSDVSDVVDGIMPSLLRIFTTADNLVNFDANGAEDEAQADQETDYVSYVFFKENPAFMILFSWFFDALLQKNGIVMAFWDESERVTEESYRGLNDDEVADLLDDEELDPIERDERIEKTVVDGQPVETTVHDLKFRRVNKRGKVLVEPVPPEEYRISSDSRNLDPSKARMVGRERMMSRTDLIDMGFDDEFINDLPAEKDSVKTGEDRARRDKTDDRKGKTQDKSQELIKVREAYIKVDFDDDGRAELRQIFTGSDKLLKWENGEMANDTIDRQPFHIICPKPLPHKHFGGCPGENVIDVQEVSTTLLRQVLMNLYHTNNPGHSVWEQGMGENTLDDLLTTKVGRVVRFSRPVGESHAQLTIPFTAGATFPMLEYFDKVKRDRTGISSDAEGLSPEALKNIQTTVLAQAVDLSKMKIEAIARVFAETGIKSLFLHIHELLQKHQNKQKVVKLRNEWIEINPSEWKTRENMTVGIGLGIGTREQNLLHLNAISERQKQQVEGGGMNLLVTPQNIWNTNKEFVKNANLKDPAMFFTNPGDELAPPPQDEQREFEEMQAKLEQRRQQLDSDRNQINIQRVELDREKLQLEHEREIAKLEQKDEERKDKFAVDNEKLRNELARLREESEVDPLEEAKTKAEIEKIRAETAKSEADTAKLREEAIAQDIENEATKAGIAELVGNAETAEA